MYIQCIFSDKPLFVHSMYIFRQFFMYIQCLFIEAVLLCTFCVYLLRRFLCSFNKFLLIWFVMYILCLFVAEVPRFSHVHAIQLCYIGLTYNY